MATIIGIITVVSAVVGLAAADDKRAKKTPNKKVAQYFVSVGPTFDF